MMQTKPTKRPPPVDQSSLEATAQRLRFTREVLLQYTTTQMCRHMGSGSGGSAWTNYEMGRRLISIQHALNLCSGCQLTLDWIYRGEPMGLAPHWQDAVRQWRLSSRA